MNDRIIKFRGKSKDLNIFVYGYYFYSEIENKHYIIGESKDYGFQKVEVNPETVGQFAICVDKAEVYEGDRVRFTEFDCFDNDTQHEGIIKYSGSRFEIWQSENYEGHSFDLDWVISQDPELEIIGDTYTTPDLI